MLLFPACDNLLGDIDNLSDRLSLVVEVYSQTIINLFSNLDLKCGVEKPSALPRTN